MYFMPTYAACDHAFCNKSTEATVDNDNAMRKRTEHTVGQV